MSASSPSLLGVSSVVVGKEGGSCYEPSLIIVIVSKCHSTVLER